MNSTRTTFETLLAHDPVPQIIQEYLGSDLPFIPDEKDTYKKISSDLQHFYNILNLMFEKIKIIGCSQSFLKEIEKFSFSISFQKAAYFCAVQLKNDANDFEDIIKYVKYKPESPERPQLSDSERARQLSVALLQNSEMISQIEKLLAHSNLPVIDDQPKSKTVQKANQLIEDYFIEVLHFNATIPQNLFVELVGKLNVSDAGARLEKYIKTNFVDEYEKITRLLLQSLSKNFDKANLFIFFIQKRIERNFTIDIFNSMQGSVSLVQTIEIINPLMKLYRSCIDKVKVISTVESSFQALQKVLPDDGLLNHFLRSMSLAETADAKGNVLLQFIKKVTTFKEFNEPEFDTSKYNLMKLVFAIIETVQKEQKFYQETSLQSTDVSDEEYTAKNLRKAIVELDADKLEKIIYRLDPNTIVDEANGSTALIFAIQQKFSRGVAIFLSHPAIDIDRQDILGLTPAMYAATSSQFQILYMLIKRGADLSMMNNASTTIFDLQKIKKPIVFVPNKLILNQQELIKRLSEWISFLSHNKKPRQEIPPIFKQIISKSFIFTIHIPDDKEGEIARSISKLIDMFLLNINAIKNYGALLSRIIQLKSEITDLLYSYAIEFDDIEDEIVSKKQEDTDLISDDEFGDWKPRTYDEADWGASLEADTTTADEVDVSENLELNKEVKSTPKLQQPKIIKKDLGDLMSLVIAVFYTIDQTFKKINPSQADLIRWVDDLKLDFSLDFEIGSVLKQAKTQFVQTLEKIPAESISLKTIELEFESFTNILFCNLDDAAKHALYLIPQFNFKQMIPPPEEKRDDTCKIKKDADESPKEGYELASIPFFGIKTREKKEYKSAREDVLAISTCRR